MAIDTAIKRFTISRLSNPGWLFPPATSGLSTAEKLAALGLYSGITPTVVDPGELELSLRAVSGLALSLAAGDDLALSLRAVSEVALTMGVEA